MKGADITVKNVVKSFGSFQALKSVSLEIKKGEFYSLLGPSGCGKTTLLRVIAGFEDPDSGTVLIDNADVQGLPPDKRHCNTVFQSYALFPHLSVFENVAFPLRIKKIPSRIIKEKVMEHLRLVQLENQSAKKPSMLSGGQKQRVAIARALINQPSVLLLDEPLSALDAKLRQKMLVELDSIHDKVGITFIYVTHDQQEALSVSDRLAVMDQGQVLQIGTPKEIYENPNSNFVARFIGEMNIISGVVEKRVDDLAIVRTDHFGPLWVEANGEAPIGAEVSLAVRPEKLRIGQTHPGEQQGINVFKGIVAEPIYWGFQTKYIIHLETGAELIVYRPHANWSEGIPDIQWKHEIYVYWSARDALVVESDQPHDTHLVHAE